MTKIREFDTVSGVPDEVWPQSERFAGLFSSPEWFRLAEAAGARFRYLVTPSSDPAMLPVLVDGVRPGGGYDHASSVLRPALGSAPGWTPCLTVGSWNSTVSIGPVRSDPEAHGSTAAVAGLVERALSLSTEHAHRSLAWPFLTQDAAARIIAAKPENTLVLRCEPTTFMEIRQPSFEEHLAEMSARRRWKLLREERRFSDAGLELGVEPLAEIADEALNLIVAGTARRGGLADRKRTESLLMAQADIMGRRMIAFTARRAGRLVAVTTAIASHGGFHTRSFGATDDLVDRDGAYFVLAYGAPLRYAHEQDLNWVYAGLGAYEAKARRGFQLLPLWTAFITERPVTDEERAAAGKWNASVETRWRDWYRTKLRTELPDCWRWSYGRE
ncbi:peptidogalycan biosysnthesis protein [Nocardiopsis sp. LOL_012]|uniref:peptidogalycan biosysnthesis protein n=1 Tax=Nocardiopsis sp. LOL_012 TaxID=3345409 RepID=UPI003A88AEA9